MKRGTVLSSGLRVETDIADERLWQRLIAHYAQGRDALWACPVCGGEIDAASDDRNGDKYEDTYRCVGDCDLLITHITPVAHTAYWQTDLDEWTVLVEHRLPFATWQWPDRTDGMEAT